MFLFSPVYDNDSSKEAEFHNEEQISLPFFSSSFQYCFFDYYNSINKFIMNRLFSILFVCRTQILMFYIAVLCSCLLRKCYIKLTCFVLEKLRRDLMTLDFPFPSFSLYQCQFLNRIGISSADLGPNRTQPNSVTKI